MARVPGLDFVWVPRTDTNRTQPTLERARYCCEHCRRDDGLRVVEGVGKNAGETAVLCPECALGNRFSAVVTHRRQRAEDGALRAGRWGG